MTRRHERLSLFVFGISQSSFSLRSARRHGSNITTNTVEDYHSQPSGITGQIETIHMDMRKRSSSTAAVEIMDWPPVKHQRIERQSRSWQPRCVFMVEHIRKHRLQFHNRNAAEGEKRSCGMFVSLADANCRVQDVMEDVAGEFWLNNDPGEDLTFYKGSDEYHGDPGYDGEKVGSSWEFDDWQSDVTHRVYVRAYPLAWPTYRGEHGAHGGHGLGQSEVKERDIHGNEMEWIKV